MTDADLTEVWNEVRAKLPDGLRLEGLEPEERSNDWIAVALDADGREITSRASTPMDALRGLAAGAQAAPMRRGHRRR
jgi:uncharacterized protein (DUF2342 family)